mmetsp:Transcript_87694/g.151991  ORF Transcript_87694/g.151991 Transcript_87694/m.151991 type:complete len:609 (+) Transcript_87694:74-1900(+)
MPSKTRTRNKVREAPSASGPTEKEAQIPIDVPCSEESCLNSLLFAVAEQNLEKVAECISKGHDLHDTPLEGCTPLLLAIKLGNFEIVRMLVQNGASCCSADENGTTVLHHAAVNGLPKIANCLVVDGGALLDQQNLAGCTPFYQAVQHGHVDCVQAFLALRANIETRTRSGATPLYIAADRGNLELVKLLLGANADANIVTEMQMTPLLVAAFNGHVDVVEAILERSVDVEQRGPCGGTALYVAAQEGRQHVVEFLIQKGAKIDTRCDGDGNLTPSLIAAMQGHDDLVRLLVKAKGDLGVRTGKGSSLAIMAARHGRMNVLQLLVELGGPKLLEDQDTEGLSVMGASKLGRHTETTSYIKKALASQREADLSAWEANLPEILQELDPPCKKKTKAKSKQKGKAIGKHGGTGLEVAAVGSPDTCGHEKETPATDAVNIGTKAVEEVHGDGCTADCHSERSEDKDVAEGPWTQVRRKGTAKPSLAIAPPESPALSSKGRPVPHISPIASPSALGQVTPMSAQSGMTSPFGLSSVVPLWPSTPESWPHSHFDDGFGSTFWQNLPPAVDTMALTVPEKAYTGLHHQDTSLLPLHLNSTLSVTECCQSIFAAS